MTGGIVLGSASTLAQRVDIDEHVVGFGPVERGAAAVNAGDLGGFAAPVDEDDRRHSPKNSLSFPSGPNRTG